MITKLGGMYYYIHFVEKGTKVYKFMSVGQVSTVDH